MITSLTTLAIPSYGFKNNSMNFRRLIFIKTLCLTLCCLFSATDFVAAQEASVKPGINDKFINPTAEDLASFVERFEKEGREIYDQRENIIACCQLRPGMDVADVGAGTGLFARLIAPKVNKLYAVDINDTFLDHIKSSCDSANVENVETVLCTTDSVELQPNSVDLIFICDTYHHFEFPYKTMRSIYNALKPEGVVVLVEFDRIEGESSEWILGHVRADRETFTKEIELAGFEEIELKDDFFETSYLKRFKKSARKTEAGHTADSIEDVKSALADKTATILDIREQAEWDAGHLANSTLVPLSKIKTMADDAEKLGEFFPKDQIIYLHCKAGGRTLKTAELLKSHDYDIRPLAWGFDRLVEEGLEKAGAEKDE
jgi:ubiquinone/menaquinone biosynthesis C-methylase UbiE/rhodanese-related sulfurtransferase